MSMKAHVLRDSVGNITVYMDGDFSYDNSSPLRDQLINLVVDHPESNVSIDMSGIEFVGSSGIGHFVETLKTLADRRASQIRMTNVHEDFHRIFKLYGLTSESVDIDGFDLESPETFHLNREYGNRKRTFEQ